MKPLSKSLSISIDQDLRQGKSKSYILGKYPITERSYYRHLNKVSVKKNNGSGVAKKELICRIKPLLQKDFDQIISGLNQIVNDYQKDEFSRC